MNDIPHAVDEVLVKELTRPGREWEEAPGVYLIYVSDGEPRISQLPAPDMVWSVSRPPQVLMGMAEAISSNSPLFTFLAPEDLYGAAFRCEAWMAAVPEGDETAAQSVMADAEARRLHQRPDRIEVRQMMAVDRDGLTYMAVQERETGRINHWITPGPSLKLGGVVPDALRLLVKSLLGSL